VVVRVELEVEDRKVLPHSLDRLGLGDGRHASVTIPLAGWNVPQRGLRSVPAGTPRNEVNDVVD